MTSKTARRIHPPTMHSDVGDTITGSRARSLRERFGMTGAQWAGVLGVSESTLRRWEGQGAKDVKADAGSLQVLTLLSFVDDVAEDDAFEGARKEVTGAYDKQGPVASRFFLLRFVLHEEWQARVNSAPKVAGVAGEE